MHLVITDYPISLINMAAFFSRRRRWVAFQAGGRHRERNSRVLHWGSEDKMALRGEEILTSSMVFIEDAAQPLRKQVLS